MTRIALDGRYIQDHFPGIGRYTYELARCLPPLAPDWEFLLLSDPHAVNTRFGWEALVRWPNMRRIPVEASPFGAQHQWAVPRLLRRHGVALYHSPYFLMPYHLPCPSVVTIHDLIPLRFPQSLPRPHQARLFRLLIRLCTRRATHVIIDSHATLVDLIHDSLALEAQATAIPLGVAAHFAPQSPQDVVAYRARVGLARPYALYLGINKPHKNLATLLRAWAALPATLREKYTLALAGQQDPRYAEGPTLAEALGIAQSVRFMGDIPESDLPLLYSGAACFVFPSLYEGFGLPILEAMACGAPVACSNVSSMPEVASEAALLFDPVDPGDIANALAQLLTDETLRQRLSAAGRVRASMFTWERTAADTLQVYRRLLAQAK